MSREPEALDELARRARLLVDLDRLPGAHHAQLGVALVQPGLAASAASVSTTITAWLAARLGLAGAERLGERVAHRRPSPAPGQG